jgi:hypothetical protein
LIAFTHWDECKVVYKAPKHFPKISINFYMFWQLISHFHGGTTLSLTTLIITTFSITTLSIKSLFVTLRITKLWLCWVSRSIYWLSVIMLSVVMLSVVAPYSQHFTFLVTCEWVQYARVFVPGEPFQSSVMQHYI